MTPYQKGITVMDYLQNWGLGMIAVGKAIDNKNLEKSYQLIQKNPTISKEEFLAEMEIEEENY